LKSGAAEKYSPAGKAGTGCGKGALVLQPESDAPGACGLPSPGQMRWSKGLFDREKKKASRRELSAGI